jgi:hypothetical protein
LPAVPEWPTIHELPDICIEAAELILYPDECSGIPDCGSYLEPIADNPGIRKEFAHFKIIISGNHSGIKIIESAAEVFPLPQDGFPTETGLRPLKNQEFEE